jgi:hypothetical protein
MERVILEEIGEANDNPDDLVHEMFVRSFWRGHPLAAPILGTVETVKGITLTDLYRYYRERYAPGNLIISVAGHVSARDVAASVETLFRRRAGRHVRAGRPSAKPRPHQHLQLSHAAASSRCTSVSAWRAPRRVPRPVLRSTCSTSSWAAECLRGSFRRFAKSEVWPTRSRPLSILIDSADTRPCTRPALRRTSPGSWK